MMVMVSLNTIYGHDPKSGRKKTPYFQGASFRKWGEGTLLGEK
jgi:hypothetical protein